ncbi:hypothetical protein SAMN05216389_11128 [Oceanobacillus limi]|uniref:Uncharacterized protein n=1 Tax=Oceanobacillus limi TaxID=930131 RepID=A0A1I0EDS0_9BACI|nr:hypothetical protein [Oceanobacillus limi]SET42586.1 hypothetical protein SAMN05216389_11128 [Oceanobacillus limi]
MDVLNDIAKIIGMVLLVVFLVPLVLTALAYIGYFFGLIIAFLAGGVLTGVFPITSATTIPYVIAWLFVIGGVFSLGGRKSE